MNEITKEKILTEVTKLEIFPQVLEKLIVDYIPNIKLCIEKEQISWFSEFTNVFIQLLDLQCFTKLKIDNTDKENKCLLIIGLPGFTFNDYRDVKFESLHTVRLVEFYLDFLVDFNNQHVYDDYLSEINKSRILNHYKFMSTSQSGFLFYIRKDIYKIIECEIDHIRESLLNLIS